MKNAFLALASIIIFAARISAAPVLQKAEAWTPHKLSTPKTQQIPEGIDLAGNGAPTCCGGWQYLYTGVEPGQTYRITARSTHRGIANPIDSLVVMVLWDRWDPKNADSGSTPWDYLSITKSGANATDFEAVLKAPANAQKLTVRYTLRWTEQGSVRFTSPAIEPVRPPEKSPVRVAIVTQPQRTKDRTAKIQPISQGLGLPKDVAESIDLWGSLILKACESKPQLIVTPEVVIGGKDRIDGAVEVPGPATRPFEKIAKENNVYLVLGMRQREGNAYYNICALVGPSGKVEGIYRKVHLATSEGLSGLCAGDSFPVFNTKIGKIGCLICMDTMLPESSRMLALAGADFICMPIMGDLRADRWTPGPPIWSEDRWKALMRTRAIDNQVTMVIARNNGQGSCVIDRKGEILAYNEGELEVTAATLPAEDGYLSWNGGDVRSTTWMLRRPHLYMPFVDESKLGR